MKRTVVITQPTYLPWLGYFEQMRRADAFVFLDSVQFERRSWQSRNRLQSTDGRLVWLSVPLKAQPRETRICDIEISGHEPDWGEGHLRLISDHLRRAPQTGEAIRLVGESLRTPPVRLVDLNIGLIRTLSDYLGLTPEFLRSSELPVTGSKGELIVSLLRHLGATHYYSAAGSADYLDAVKPLFDEAGISYSYQTWNHPSYHLPGHPSTTHLSVIDALSWVGREGVRAMIGLDS